MVEIKELYKIEGGNCMTDGMIMPGVLLFGGAFGLFQDATNAYWNRVVDYCF